MVADIRAMGYEIGNYAARPISEEVLSVMAKVPRHRFVPGHETGSAYYNHPLPIGCGQTISQPYIVALMTDLLKLDKQHTVLEVGTGSGYQTAILAELAGKVYSMEIIAQLAGRAESVLRELGYTNIFLGSGDGRYGWPEHAPFDAIIVTATAEHMPQALPQQIRPGGRMVVPVGGVFGQELLLVTRSLDGSFQQQSILPVRFVPLTGGEDAGNDTGSGGAQPGQT